MLDNNSKNNSIQKIDLSKNDNFYTKIKDYAFNQLRAYLPSRLQEQNKILEESKKRTIDLVKKKEDFKNVTK